MLPDTARTMIDGMPILLVKLHEATFHDKDVIYIVLDIEPDGTKRILDVGQSPEYGSPHMDLPDRRACWLSHATTPDIYVGLYRLPSDRNMDSDRHAIILHLRHKYRPPCSPITELPHSPHPSSHLSHSLITTPAPVPPLPRPPAPEIVDPLYIPEMP